MIVCENEKSGSAFSTSVFSPAFRASPGVPGFPQRGKLPPVRTLGVMRENLEPT